jgi:hypothetical protein
MKEVKKQYLIENNLKTTIMYSKFEIHLIFSSIKNIDEYDKVVDAMHYLIKYDFLERSDYLFRIANKFFIKFYIK